jgi:hypothetical protein
MRNGFFIIAFFTSISIFAQQKEIDFDAVDSLYREDQFYVSISYNSLQNRPSGIKQNKISTGITLGFLRDMPINKNRTLSIATGLGYSLGIYNQNLGIVENNANNSYEVLGVTSEYSKAKLSLHYIDLPIEFRWRNSTFDSHIFWRAYLGVKLSYLFYDQYRLESSLGNFDIVHNKDLNQLQYGVYLATGWNTWNIFAYYGLSPLFKSSAQLGGQSMNMNTVNFGLFFYIL